jgi:hypothetical protein
MINSAPHFLSFETKYSPWFLVGTGLLIVLYVFIMSMDIDEPFVGLHSWAQAHISWWARSHVVYGLEYTKGLYTWAVGFPPKEVAEHYLDHPQLPGLFNAVSMLVFGVHDWSQRLGALIISAVSLPFAIALIQRLYGERIALLSGSIYVLFPITGYFYWIGALMFPFVIGAFWSYLALIDGFSEQNGPRRIHVAGLVICLFLMIQINWSGFMYAATIGTHYVLHCLSKKTYPQTSLFLLLLITPFLSLFLVFLILVAARDWNYQAMIEIFLWRSAIPADSGRDLASWWHNLSVMMRDNFTSPALLLAGLGIALALHSKIKLYLQKAASSYQPLVDGSSSISKNANSLRFIWLFIMPGVFYALVFTEAMFDHQYMYRHFSLFVAIAAASGIYRIWGVLATRKPVIADTVFILLFAFIVIFCAIGLNQYRQIQWYPPKKLEMFERIQASIPPNEALLSYESYLVFEHEAKGLFYRPEVAWYLDREIIVVRSFEEIQHRAESGENTRYLMSNTQVPLFQQMRNFYSYEYVQGRPYRKDQARMPSYHIFDLTKPK